jgi:large subunit ribosomal protein L24
MSRPKMHIKKGDTAVIISGKEKGKKGKVLLVSPGKNRAIVEALNMVTHHERPSSRNPQGGLVQKETNLGARPLRCLRKDWGFETSWRFLA